MNDELDRDSAPGGPEAAGATPETMTPDSAAEAPPPPPAAAAAPPPPAPRVPFVPMPSLPPRRSRRFMSFAAMTVIAGAAFLIGLLVFNDVVMPRLVHRVNEQRVPDLSNLTLDQAEKLLGARGLAVSRSGERFDPNVPRGFVLSQDPPAETPFRGSMRVSVVISLGEEFSSVPELFGESMRTAAYLLGRAGLRLGGITHAPSEVVGAGLIADTDPGAEGVLPRDTPVGVLVSTGGAEESFVMPDLLGHEVGGVKRQLEAYGFRVLMPPAAPSIGTIVYQDPPPGSRITRQAQILVQATGRRLIR